MYVNVKSTFGKHLHHLHRHRFIAKDSLSHSSRKLCFSVFVSERDSVVVVNDLRSMTRCVIEVRRSEPSSTMLILPPSVLSVICEKLDSSGLTPNSLALLFADLSKLRVSYLLRKQWISLARLHIERDLSPPTLFPFFFCLPGCVALVALAGIGIATCQLHHTALAKGLVMQILYTCLQIAIHCGLLWWRWRHNGRRCWGVVRFNAGRFKAMLIIGISWCARSPRCVGAGGSCGLVGWEAIAACPRTAWVGTWHCIGC